MILVKALVLFSVIAGNLGCQSVSENLSNQYPPATSTTAKPTTSTPSKPKDLCSACKDGCTGTLEKEDVKLEVFKGDLYYFVTDSTQYRWDPADKACQAWFPGQGHSVSFHSEAEFNWVKQRVLENEMDVVHIGAHRQRGKWYWTDKTEVNNTLFDQFWLHSGAGIVGNVMQIHSTEESYGFIGIRGPTSTASFICKVTCADSSTCSFGDEASERLRACPMTNVQGGSNTGTSCTQRLGSCGPVVPVVTAVPVVPVVTAVPVVTVVPVGPNPNRIIIGAPGFCRCGMKGKTTDQCTQSRIIGGGNTEVKEFPWMAALAKTGTTSMFCGGSVIGERWVLTAAHCLFKDPVLNFGEPEVFPQYEDNELQVLLGMHDWTIDSEYDGLIRKSLTSYIKDGFSMTTTTGLDNDIALLRLETPIDFIANSHISPICLPVLDNNYIDFEAILTGYSFFAESPLRFPNKLQKLQMKVLSNEECDILKTTTITDKMLCALNSNPASGTCLGDSGGPLVTNIHEIGQPSNPKENYEQIGVVSVGGTTTCDGDIPTTYSRVTKNMDWINSVVNSDVFGGLNSCQRPDICVECKSQPGTQCNVNIGEKKISLEKYKNSLYYFDTMATSKGPKSWHEAERSCRSLFGTTLASFQDKEEFEFLVKQIKSKNMIMTSFGARKYSHVPEDRYWSWTDNSPFNHFLFDNENQGLWYKGQIPEAEEEKDYLEYWNYAYSGIKDVTEDDGKIKRGYVCKIQCNEL